jgi:hypothetical protein
MQTNKFLVAAVLATAIGAPIAGLVAGTEGQPMTSPELPVPLLHGFTIGRSVVKPSWLL